LQRAHDKDGSVNLGNRVRVTVEDDEIGRDALETASDLSNNDNGWRGDRGVGTNDCGELRVSPSGELELADGTEEGTKIAAGGAARTLDLEASVGTTTGPSDWVVLRVLGGLFPSVVSCWLVRGSAVRLRMLRGGRGSVVLRPSLA
jgi:hypothetical protein